MEKNLDEVDFLVNNGQFVTCRQLASILDVSYQVAVRILTEYHNLHQFIRATYFLSGVSLDSQKVVSIVKDSDLESAMQLFSTLDSKLLYSVHKDCPDNIFSQLSLTNNDQKLNHETFLLNNNSVIKNEYVQLRPIGVKVTPINPYLLSFHEVGATAALGTVKKVVSSSAKDFFKPSSASSTPKELYNVDKAATHQGKAVKIVLPATSAIEGRQELSRTTISKSDEGNSTIMKSSEDSKNKVPDGNVVDTSKVNETVKASKIVDDEEDEEWDDGGGYKTKPKELRKKTFRPSKKHIEADSSLEKENVRLASETEADEGSADVEIETGKLKKQKVSTVGAMDGFMTNNEDNVDVAHDSVSAGIGGKKLTKRLVEKMYMDDRGFLVTNMEYEEVEVDEVEGGGAESTSGDAKGTVSSAIVKEKSKDAAPQPGKKGKGKMTASDTAPQRSISSFFTKKN